MAGLEMKLGTNIRDFDFIRQILYAIAKPTPSALNGIESAVRAGFAGNFAREAVGGGGPWPSLAPRTQRERAAAGYGATGPMLRRSGAYMRSWTDQGGWRSLEVSPVGWTFHVASAHRWAFAHELGDRGRNLPARPVRYLDTGQERVVATAVENWVDQIIALVMT